MPAPWTVDVGDLQLNARVAPAPDERAIVVLVHGFGEHAGRYDAQREFLTARGFSTVSFDLRGHGTSPGPRTRVPVVRHVRDLLAIREAVRERWRRETGGVPPVVLFGHSMGGLIAAEAAVRNPFDIDGLVLSSPSLQVGESTPAPVRVLGPFLGRLLPALPVGGVDPDAISRIPEEVSAYENDPLVHHGPVPALAGATMMADGRSMYTDRCRWIPVPTLLLQGSDDRVVSATGAREFARLAGTAVDPRPKVVYREFDGGYHELFNDTCADEAYAALGKWLDALSA